MADYPWEKSICRRALALNPATPLDVLLALAQRNPDLVLANPSLRLHLAADPGCLNRAWPYIQVALVRCPTVDPAIIRQLATLRSAPVSVRVAAATNPRCPEDLLRAYLRHARPVRLAMAGNPSIPEDVAEEVLRMEAERAARRQDRAIASVHEPVSEPATQSCVRWSGRWRQRVRRSQREAAWLKI